MNKTMMKKAKLQRKLFEEKARELECDEDEDRFNDTLKQIAKHDKNKEDKSLKDTKAT